jgi:hypothetical protein
MLSVVGGRALPVSYPGITGAHRSIQPSVAAMLLRAWLASLTGLSIRTAAGLSGWSAAGVSIA